MAALRKVEGGGEVPAAANGADEDRDLTLSFQRGEADAYQCIYNRYRWSVYNACYRILGNRDDAQEATQEAFLKVYQALGRFNGNYRLGPWIIRIATNVSLDHLRLRKRRPQDSVSIDALHREPCAYADDPEQMLVERAEGERVRKVLSSLPPIHRAAIVLRDSEGLTYSEIALKLGISEGQVKALLHRARKRFKRTWVPAPVLFPGHVLDRLRDRLLVSRASNGLMGTASPVADLASASSSVMSSGVMEHVAGIAGERIAPVVAAAVLGAATVAATVGWVETGSDRNGSEGFAPSVATKEGSPAPWRAEVSASAKVPSGNVVAPVDEGFADESHPGDEEAAGERKPYGEDAQIAGPIEGEDSQESKDDEKMVSGENPSEVASSLPGDGQGLTRDPPPPPTACSDGQDNDGLTDLQVTGCADNPEGTDETPITSPPSPPSPECSDGQDNDGDELVDLGDPGCADDPGGIAENSEQEASSTSPPG